jgi:hypothetical protein
MRVALLALLLVCFGYETAASQEICSLLRRLGLDAVNNFANVRDLKLPNAERCEVDDDDEYWCHWDNATIKEPRREFEKFVKDIQACFPQAKFDRLKSSDDSAFIRFRAFEFYVSYDEDEIAFSASKVE